MHAFKKTVHDGYDWMPRPSGGLQGRKIVDLTGQKHITRIQNRVSYFHKQLAKTRPVPTIYAYPVTCCQSLKLRSHTAVETADDRESSRCDRKTASDAAIVTIACRSNKPICIMNQDRDHTTPGTLEHAACCQQSLDGRLLLALKKWIVNRFQYLNGRFNRIECGLNFRTPV